MAAVLIAALGAPGCSPVRPAPAALDSGGRTAVLTVEAEWRHIEAAMGIAARQAEMAILEQQISPDFKRFEIQTVRAEPGWLTARPATNQSFEADQSIPIQLEASVGLFGDRDAERRLLRALADRLQQLRGREWAPVR